MKRLLLAALAVLNMGAMPSHPQAAHLADPASCGAACGNANVATFPFDNRIMRSFGNSAGEVYDGSYVYLGELTINGVTYGYIATSNHSGGYTNDNSFEFLNGSAAGKHYRSTGRQITSGSWGGNRLSYLPNYGTAPLLMTGPGLIEVTTMNYVAGCTAAGVPNACCLGYGLGPDGGGGFCAGTTDALPGFSFMPMANPRTLTEGALTISYGNGVADPASTTAQWYKECNASTSRGGTGVVDACCADTDGAGPLGLQFTGSTFTRLSPGGDGVWYEAGSALTAADAAIGGIGQDCDTAAGYTYLGPVRADSSLDSTSRRRWITNKFTRRANYYPYFPTYDPGTFSKLKSELSCVTHTDVDASEVTLSNWTSHLVTGGPRAGNADCGASLLAGVSGDSGTSVFVLDGTTWKFLGIANAGVSYTLGMTSVVFPGAVFSFGMTEWWWRPALLGLTPGAP